MNGGGAHEVEGANEVGLEVFAVDDYIYRIVLKTLAVVVFLAVVLPIDGQSHCSISSSDQNGPADLKKSLTLPPRTVQCTVENDGTTTKCNWAEVEPESYFKRLLGPENAPNIALFFVGLGGIFVALCTLKRIERQTKAAEDASVTASQQTGHMIASERAWIVMAPTKKKQPLEAGKPPMFWWTIKNVGKTPARLIDTQAVCTVSDDGWNIDGPPEFPQPILLNMRLLPPGGELEFFTYWTERTKHGKFSPFAADIAVVDPLFLMAYGFVRYTSIFDEDSRYSSFCDVFYSPQVGRPDAKTVIEFHPHWEAPRLYTEHT